MQRFALLMSNNMPTLFRPFATASASVSTAAKAAEGEVKKTRKSSKKSTPKAPRTKPSGLEIPIRLSPELSSFMGINMASRVEVQKKVWEYIKKNNLQKADNKREIQCDATLKQLLGVDNVNMLKLTGLLNKHFEKTPKA